MNRKEAIREYKERKPNRGVFEYRCATTGAVWVDWTPNLDAARNGLEFALRVGGHRNHALQLAWNTHGADAFAFSVLERFDEDVLPLALKDLSKERRTYWLEKLNALTVSP
jgi:hypothetical protein